MSEYQAQRKLGEWGEEVAGWTDTRCVCSRNAPVRTCGVVIRGRHAVNGWSQVQLCRCALLSLSASSSCRLDEALNAASMQFYGKKCMHQGEGKDRHHSRKRKTRDGFSKNSLIDRRTERQRATPHCPCRSCRRSVTRPPPPLAPRCVAPLLTCIASFSAGAPGCPSPSLSSFVPPLLS